MCVCVCGGVCVCVCVWVCVCFSLCVCVWQVNLFFLLNIVRVLVTKLRDTHRAESNMYMKAVRATLILVPLLGIQFVIFPWRPENQLAGEVYDYIMHILMHYQVPESLWPYSHTVQQKDLYMCKMYTATHKYRTKKINILLQQQYIYILPSKI